MDRPQATWRRGAWIALAAVLALVSLLAARWLRGERDVDGVHADAPDERAEDGPDARLVEPRPRAAPSGVEPERSAVATEPVEEPAPPDADERDVVRGAPFALRVRDAASRLELSDVELASQAATSMRASWRRPHAHEQVSRFPAGLASPITLWPWRHAGVDAELLNGWGWLAASGAERSMELARPRNTSQGFAFWARAEGYAWGRVLVDVTAGGERELLLAPEATVRIELANVDRPAYAALAREAHLFVRRTDVDTDDVMTVRVVDDALAGGAAAVLEGCEPGAYRVSVELGRYYDRGREVLAEESFVLSPGERRELLLHLADAPAPRERATLAGTLAFPPFPAEETVVLRLFDLAGSGSVNEAEVPIASMDRIGGEGSAWRWSAGELATGTYQAKVWPFLVDFRVELPPPGRDDVALVLAELAAVEVEVLDASDSARVALPRLFFGTQRPFEGKVNHVGLSVEPSEPGLFRFWTTPGRVEANVWDADTLGYGSANLVVEAPAGPSRHALLLEKLNAIRFVFKEGDAVLPRTELICRYLAQGITAVDGTGVVTHDRSRTEGVIELTAPGVYDISFERVASEGYLPIEPRRVEVRAGVVTEVVVQLERE